MYRRRRNIRFYVKIVVGVILVLFFISLIQFMGQIEPPSPKRDAENYMAVNDEKPLGSEQKLNRIREKMVASRLGLTVAANPVIRQDLDMNRYELKRTMGSLQRLVHLDLKVVALFTTLLCL